MKRNNYQLVDSGRGQKLERFGPYLLARPAAQAAWSPQLPEQSWCEADAIYVREEGKNWSIKRAMPPHWILDLSGIAFKLQLTDFGHLGIFPEQQEFWKWTQEVIRKAHKKDLHLLNLFAYSGGATLAAAKAGASVCHLDASRGMVTWARENAELNGLGKAPIRWIVDDVKKFLRRERRRGRQYDAIILDPPTFGRGAKGEVFKIEEDLIDILEWCRELLTENSLFVLLTCHTPGYTPTVLQHLLSQCLTNLGGSFDSGEMLLSGEKNIFPLPSGCYARWYNGL